MFRSSKVFKAVLLIFIGFTSILFIAYFLQEENDVFMNVSEWRCDNDGTTLQTHDARLLCLGHRNIFFVESSSSGQLNPRQACSVESAARHNPSHDVKVLMTTAKDILRTDLMMDLKNIPNVDILGVDYEVVVFGTPLWNWYREAKWKKSNHQIVHLSDALRLLLVWKYGGFYLDLDVVVLRPLDPLSNSTSSDNNINASNCVLVFDREHPLLKRCIADFAATYNHKGFADNGPVLLTRNIKDFCQVVDLFKTSTTNCEVRVLPANATCPIPYERWEDYFSPMANVRVDLSSSYLIHVWNKMSSGRNLTIGGGSLYEMAMKENCPTTYKHIQQLGHL